MRFGDKVRNLMSGSQAELAEAVGTSQQRVSHWIRNNRPPQDTAKLLRLARALGTTVDYLLDDAAEEPPGIVEMPEDEAKVLGVYRDLKADPAQGLDASEAVRRLSRPSDAPRKTPGRFEDAEPPPARPQRPPRRSGGHGGG